MTTLTAILLFSLAYHQSRTIFLVSITPKPCRQLPYNTELQNMLTFQTPKAQNAHIKPSLQNHDKIGGILGKVEPK